ncbi:nitroreductase family protein [Tahibacter soli]|uniref:Putative NAD(P)H nitroreductase n=1 Tax=Tahibacter soli TaxID=2983605 RepID=A0A9X3YQ75_9GAMM|nr:nitroreductase [Tahibacter soli]MDC8014903.1 nitroreductase [Tahibacter soli]
MAALKILDDRRSVPSRQLGEPGPSPGELDALLEAASRVPDHGKLVPWRFVLVRGGARARLGELLVAVNARKNPDVAPAALDKDRQRFNFAPLIVTVVGRIDEHHAKIPAQEQVLSVGCVAYNLLLGAQALGYGAQWLTGWAAYDADIAAALGLAANERIIGFVHIGTAREPAPERLRPDAKALTTEWNG